MMKVKGYYYEVLSPSGNGGLCITHNEKYKDVIEDIRRIEEQAEVDSWKREKWLIVRVNWRRTYDDNGVFSGSEQKRIVFGCWDNGAVEDYVQNIESCDAQPNFQEIG